MIELLLYVSKLKHAPNGESLTATSRLALLQMILIGGGEAIEIDPEKFAPLVGLTHSKSVPRLLKQMAAAELIATTYPRSKAGRRSFTVCYPLPSKRRKPSNIEVTRLLDPSNPHVTWGAPGNIQAPGGNPQVTWDDPSNIEVTRLNYQARKDLEPPSNPHVTGSDGTQLALNTPPLNSNSLNGEGETDPSNVQVTRLRDSPAVKIWLEVVKADITEPGARMIHSRVRYLGLWKETLEGWLANPNWGRQNIDGQIERYEKKARNFTPPVETPQSKPKDKEEEERIRSAMYSDE